MTENPTTTRVRGALVAFGAVVAAALVGGCGSGGGIQSGEGVDVYVSMPLHGPEAANGRDVVNGARLALADAHGSVGKLAVHATYLDDTSGTGSDATWSGAAAAADARRATQDSAAIAYIGELDSGATRFSLPITNEAHLLQVSPAASAVDLVQPYLGAGNQVPDQVQPTGERTFGRVIPSDEAQAQAGAVWAKRLGVESVRVVGDGSSFADVMATSFSVRARESGIRVNRAKLTPPRLGCGLTGVRGGSPRRLLGYYAGARIPDRRQVSCVTNGGAGVRLMTSDALLNPAGLRALAGSPAYMTSAAEDPSQLPARGRRFVREFRRRYRGEPGRYAAYGYEAMAVVLDSIKRAGDSGADRDSVINEFFDTSNRHSVLGTYSIDDVGNTTLDRMAGYRIVRGRARFEAAIGAGR